MPYSYPDNVPKVSRNWTEAEQKKCTAAANAVLQDGGSEEDAIFACIRAAGKSKRKEMDTIPNGIVTFADLEATRMAQKQDEGVLNLAQDFKGLIDNVFESPDITNKAQAIRQLATEFENLTKEMDEEEHECPEGEDCPDEEEEEPEGKSIKERFAEWLSKTFSKPEPKKPALMLFKNRNGNWVWFARYSNKWRDNDRPPEIISEASHVRFAKLVKEGKAPYPELWLWHIPNTTWGKATWVGYDSQGFALASGYVYPGYEAVAEQLEGKSDILLSHGMPTSTIKRDADDPSIIVEHETREISPLPGWAAANKLTGFVILQENGMDELKEKGLEPEDRRKLIEDMGIPESVVDAFEKGSSFLAQVADKAGLESKETTTEEAEPEAEQVEVEETETEETVVEPTTTVPNNLLEEYGKSIEHILVAVEALGEQVKALKQEVVDVKATQSDQAAKLADTPLASKASFLMKSIVGEDDAVVDGRTKLGSDGPKESKGKSTFFFEEWA